MKNTIFIIFISIFISSGCATTPRINLSNSDEVSKNVQFKKDEFTKDVIINGPRFPTHLGVSGHGVVEEVAIDVTLMEKSNTISYAIYVGDYFTRYWRRYDKAYDKKGGEFKIYNIGRNVWCNSGCSYEEFLAIPVSRDYLEKHQVEGITMKITGGGGSEVFSIPSGYIAGILKAVPAKVKNGAGGFYVPSEILSSYKD